VKRWPDPTIRLPDLAALLATEYPVPKEAGISEVAIGLRREIAERSRNVGAD